MLNQQKSYPLLRRIFRPYTRSPHSLIAPVTKGQPPSNISSINTQTVQDLMVIPMERAINFSGGRTRVRLFFLKNDESPEEAEPRSSTARGLTFFKFVRTRLALERQEKGQQPVGEIDEEEGRREKRNDTSDRRLSRLLIPWEDEKRSFLISTNVFHRSCKFICSHPSISSVEWNMNEI